MRAEISKRIVGGMEIRIAACNGVKLFHISKRNDSRYDADEESGERWITLKNGEHVLIGGDNEVVAGAGGSLKGEKLSHAKSKTLAELHREQGTKSLQTMNRTEKNDYAKAHGEKHTSSNGKETHIIGGVGTTNTSERSKKGDDSLGKYCDKDGKLSPERAALHDKIVVDYLAHVVGKDKDGNVVFKGNVERADGQPTYTFMGGGPASGKSSVTGDKNIDSGFPKEGTAVIIDPDTLKLLLPEYKERVKAKDKDAAGYVHEESSALSKRISKVAIANGYNVALDGTGDGSVEKMEKKIQDAKNAGMKVNGIYVTCATDTAVQRAINRGDEEGRHVKPVIVRNTHIKVSRILPKIADKFDSLKLYDTNTHGKAILIATGGNGKPLTVVKGREQEYQAFLDKAHEKLTKEA